VSTAVALKPVLPVFQVRGWRADVLLFGSLHLPAILPQDVRIYALLRAAHTDLAFLLYAALIAHLGAALFHALIRRDGFLQSMA
jgi:cytochrome b561